MRFRMGENPDLQAIPNAGAGFPVRLRRRIGDKPILESPTIKGGL